MLVQKISNNLNWTQTGPHILISVNFHFVYTPLRHPFDFWEKSSTRILPVPNKSGLVDKRVSQLHLLDCIKFPTLDVLLSLSELHTEKHKHTRRNPQCKASRAKSRVKSCFSKWIINRTERKDKLTQISNKRWLFRTVKSLVLGIKKDFLDNSTVLWTWDTLCHWNLLHAEHKIVYNTFNR